MATKDGTTAVGSVTNAAKTMVETGVPYLAGLTVVGSADILFHRWNVDAVAEKASAAKGSKAKKTDDVESYVYRDSEGYICVPGDYLRESIVGAAKYRQDPRSPRKSAQDLFKAGVISMTPLARVNGGVKDWDYLDRRRVTVQRNGITRTRPAMLAGWTISFELLVNLPEYIPSSNLLEVASNAGRLVGLGDYRPTFGRFQVTKFEVISAL